jgi:hypothetical protein
MKEIKTEHYVDIYPFLEADSSAEIVSLARSSNILFKITAFPNRRVHVLGQTFKVVEAEQLHFALGRAIEIAGGW